MGAMQAAKLLAEQGAGERALSAPAPAAMPARNAACRLHIRTGQVYTGYLKTGLTQTCLQASLLALRI